ncbi:MAG: Lysine 6-dehydrogenase [Flavobacteriales bacterium]|nr:Lysine 6-dehydrogenase [Flavobacteriales bacterium]MCL4815307.1 saccharopine dehydrogenase NADP-binding domain-containing protein [Flavobacteriales bacterium]WKZ74923.1 MAG: saccharopine dehydrogenase C-terminal domain-containing protein [Vicingaceae bacterium]
MSKVIVLGTGLIGRTIAIDLHKRFDVTCADIHFPSLNELSEKHNIKTTQSNFSDKETLKKLITPYELVVCAVPGFMGFETLKTIIEAGKNVVDISFFPENALELDALAKKNNVTAIVDCGVAPGLCNILAGHHNAQESLHFYECLVGGLPKVREWPYEYKAVFSPIDVIEEYIRPARYIENGKLIVREALSDAEYIHFDNVGTLESFNTDGLRSLADTMPHVPNMKEKTLRFPGHIALMKVLRETGFFNKEKIDINGTHIAPIDFTSKLLFPKWKLNKGETDFTIMRVTLKNKKEEICYTLYDEMEIETQTTSMARTTGYTCTAAVGLFMEKLFSTKGICPPEYLGEDNDSFEYVIKYLEERNIHLKKEITNAK